MDTVSIRKWVKCFKDGNMNIMISYTTIGQEVPELNAVSRKLTLSSKRNEG